MPPSSQRPPTRASSRPARQAARAPKPHSLQPLDAREFDELQALLDRVPTPLEALDVSMVDGYLCGLLLQPRRIAVARWLPHVFDVDGRAPPPTFDTGRPSALLLRRHAELDDAIERRQWFDPWVFELGDAEEAEEADEAEGGDGTAASDDGADDAAHDHRPAPIDAVYPWVAGFATALELFPELMALDAKVLNEPLALVYRHLAPDDLEDADDLLAEIDSLEPPQDLAEAVEGLVRATLLLADISRPVATASRDPLPRRGRPSDR